MGKQMSATKKHKIPDTYVILFILMVFMTLLTWIVPAGQYEMVTDPVTGVASVDPDSFHFIERTPVTLVGFLKAFYLGCQDKAGIIFMILLLSGFSNILNDTGAISRGINQIVRKYDRRALFAIPFIMAAFSLLGASAVVVDASVAFIPVGLIIARKLKLDPLAGGAIIYLGCYGGWNTSFMAATSVQTAQEIAGLELLSGMGFRIAVYVIFNIVTIYYVMRYCIRVNQDRRNSILEPAALEQFDREVIAVEEGRFTLRDAVVLCIFFGAMIFYIAGSFFWTWGMDMMVAIVMAASLISGSLGGLSPDDMAKSFCNGVRTVSFGAVLVGAAGSLSVIMNQANITHTIIYGASLVMGAFPGALAAVVMFIINLCFNFFVPSGPAQAAIVMPIMAPLSDVLGLTRQVAVLCFQYGDGLSNCIIPTAGTLMGTLGITKVPYTIWLRFMMKLFGVWCLICGVAIVIAVFTGYH